MRQYHRTLQIFVSLCLAVAGSGIAYGEEPVYPAAPPVTQSDGYGIVPYAPHTPTMVTRPASWPQGSLRQPGVTTTPVTQAPTTSDPNANPTPVYSNPSPNYTASQNPGNVVGNGQNASRPTDLPFSEAVQIKPVPDATLLARVGSEVILTSDVMALVANRLLGEADEPIPEEHREKILENFLAASIETKLIYADVVRSIPAEGLDGFRKQVKKGFDDDKDDGLPALMKKANVKTREELEAKLQKLGSSIEAQKRLYVERTISRYWLSQAVKVNEPITHEQMLEYYHEYGTDFDNKACARWEQLTVRFSRHPDKQEAFRLIAQAGNQVMQGVPFAEVAKKFSEGSNAEKGGQRDWTHQGSLASEKLDAALFALPTGQLSRIIEDDTGYHIIRVVQREDAHRTPFLKAQEEIKKSLVDGRFQERVKDYLARIKKETMVWTAYDDKKEQQQNVANTPETNTRR